MNKSIKIKLNQKKVTNCDPSEIKNEKDFTRLWQSNNKILI